MTPWKFIKHYALEIKHTNNCQSSKHGKHQVPNLLWHGDILSYEITSVSARRLNNFSHESVIRPCSL